jgi:pSer/pThr/pTyr-binding forkhead associated (FHA) protein
MASLLVVSGKNAGDFYLLRDDPVVVGRGDRCPIQIVDEAVSRRHLRVRPDGEPGAYAVEDLESANGTWVNDRRIDAPAALSDGDILRLGGTEIMYSAIDFADAETAFQHYRKRGETPKSTILRDR